MGTEVAGFWRRFGAAFVDGVLVGVVDTILRYFLNEAGSVLAILVSFVYYTYFHGTTGQTPGDAALGIKVLDIETREVIGYQRAFVRALVAIVSYLVVFLGFLWMLWDPRRQTWHDKAAGTVPVRVGY
ncbi:MAG TPA: RDD family protein [Gaiellaceae bacterium]|jgi:uncharacterized RDD family membrane protein YckC|nr:RDD family protein [Gaiellaceae bacterium]